MSIWGAVGGLAGSLWSSSQNQASAQAAMAFQKETLQNRNQWAVEDLKKAGLNPILAAGAVQSSAQGAQSETENPANSASSSASQVNAMKLAREQQNNQNAIAKSQIDANSAKASLDNAKADESRQNVNESVARSGIYAPQADNFTSSAESNRANADYLRQKGQECVWNIQKMQSDLLTAEKERDYYTAQVKNANSQSARNAAEAGLAKAETKVAHSRKELHDEQTKGQQISNQLQSLNVPKAKYDSSWYDGNPKSGSKQSTGIGIARTFGFLQR